DPDGYERIFDAFYKGAFDAGIQVRILGEDDVDELAVATTPVLVVPALYTADESLLDALVAYAQSGGHLVLGPRSGYADHDLRARTEVQPAGVSDAAGVSYDEYSSLEAPIGVRAVAGSPLRLPPDARAASWAEGLQPIGAETLVEYEHPF